MSLQQTSPVALFHILQIEIGFNQLFPFHRLIIYQ